MPSARLIAASPEDIFGQVSPPPGVARFDAASPSGLGVVPFISTGIQLFTIVTGLYVFLNFLLAGYEYITAGDNKAHQKVREKLTNSILGIFIIVAAYTITALISYILFRDPGFILNPVISGPP